MIPLKSKKITADLVRISLYKMFIDFGGKIDYDESHAGVGEDYNKNVIDIIFNNIIDMRISYCKGYYQVLSTLITDGYAFLELDSILGPSIEILKDCIDGKIKPRGYEYLLLRANELSLFQKIKNAKNIEELEFSLRSAGQLESIKRLIIPVIGIMVDEVNKPTELFEKIHYDVMCNPDNVITLTKYNNMADMRQIYYRMLEVQSKSDSKLGILELLREMYRFYTGEDVDRARAIKYAFDLYTFCLDNFQKNLGDEFFCEIGRNIYCHLIRRVLKEEPVSEEERMLLEKFQGADYKIENLREDLIPIKNNIPELFKFFVINGKDDFVERWNLPHNVFEAYDYQLDRFDEKFKSVCLKK